MGSGGKEHLRRHGIDAIRRPVQPPLGVIEMRRPLRLAIKRPQGRGLELPGLQLLQQRAVDVARVIRRVGHGVADAAG